MDYKDMGPPADVVHSSDWRHLTPSTVVPQKPGKAPAIRTASDPLHRRARPASLARERERAVELVNAAKGVIAQTFDDLRFGRKLRAADLEPIVVGIEASLVRHPLALPSITRMKERHEYTYLHSIAVCGLMIGLARELGLDEQLTQDIGMAGLLLDVGKSRVPLRLLDKPGPLDPDEHVTIREHTRMGHDILCASGIESPIVLDVCLHHHERPDGQGYPLGISAPTLSVYARMAAVCDVYDALTSTRPYRDRVSPGAAFEIMGGSQGQFDARVFRVFREMIGIFPIGSLVRLQSQRLGVVLDEPTEDPAAPDVYVFHCAQTGQPLPGARVQTSQDPVVSMEMASRHGLKDWDTRRAKLLVEFGSF